MKKGNFNFIVCKSELCYNFLSWGGKGIHRMKDILLVGNLKTVSNELLNRFDEKQKIVLCGDVAIEEIEHKNAVSYSYREKESEYRGIFKSYNFSTVVYFSQVLDGRKRLYNEIETLENTLFSSVLNGVPNFIYVTTNDYTAEEGTTRTKLLYTCEDICRQFVDQHNISVLVLRMPYVFTQEESQSNLSKVIRKAVDENMIVMDASEHQLVDYIAAEDVGELLARIHDEPQTGFHIADISGANCMTVGKVAELISNATGVENITYKEYKAAIPTVSNDGSMRELYGWFAIHQLKYEMDEIVSKFQKKEFEAKQEKVRMIRNERIRNLVFIGTELIALFLVSELLTSWTADNYRMDYVDFRLLFVVIIGAMHGTGAGIVASLLACVGYFMRDILAGNIQIIFFNIENWLPFAAYFLTGTMMGHFRDKYQEEIRFLNEQNQSIENKYVFLSDLYGKTLKNKEEYSRQLIGYEDSFGKIYQVVRKLNTTMTDNIFYEAIYAIEEILKTTTAAIYTIGNNSHFARLNVCSREVNTKLEKSLDLSKYPEIYAELKKNLSWYNAEGYDAYPAYVAPVWKGKSLHGAIIIWNVGANQMSMDFYNKFSILSGLIQDALIRAIDFEEKQITQQVLVGTKILKAEYFEEIVSAKERMNKEGLYNFMLLKVSWKDMSLEEVGNIITNSIRNMDVLGMKKDGNVYLLLAQTNEKSLEIVRKRLESKGITLER